MLIWLDSTVNKKAHPNENYAREVMELFSLGRGHYSEKDIQEAARAFTGWFVIRDEFAVVPRQHDDGPKTVLGRTGELDGRRHPRHPDGPAGLRRVDLPQAVPPVRQRVPLALRGPDRAAGAGLPRVELPDPGSVATILRSNLFFDPVVRRRRVKSPVEFAVGTIRSLEVLKPTVAAGRAAEVVRPDGPEPVRSAERRRLGRWAGVDQLDDDAGPGEPGPRPARG